MMLVEADALSSVFDAAIAQNAQFDFDIIPPLAIGAAGVGGCRCRIQGIVLITEENLSWELWLWSKGARAGASYDVDSWRGFWKFLSTDATNLSGSTAPFRYWIPDLDIAYEDQDAQSPTATNPNGALHFSLIPRTTGGHVIHKKIVVKVFCVPEVAWA